MENIRNNETWTPDSSNQTIDVSYDTEIESKPKPQTITEPDDIYDLVWKFESEENECLYSMIQDFA